MEKGAFNQSTFANIHRMMHLGGDEIVSSCWREADPSIIAQFPSYSSNINNVAINTANE